MSFMIRRFEHINEVFRNSCVAEVDRNLNHEVKISPNSMKTTLHELWGFEFKNSRLALG